MICISRLIWAATVSFSAMAQNYVHKSVPSGSTSLLSLQSPSEDTPQIIRPRSANAGPHGGGYEGDCGKSDGGLWLHQPQGVLFPTCPMSVSCPSQEKVGFLVVQRKRSAPNRPLTPPPPCPVGPCSIFIVPPCSLSVHMYFPVRSKSEISSTVRDIFYHVWCKPRQGSNPALHGICFLA